MTTDADYLASPVGRQATELLNMVTAKMEAERISQSELARRSGYRQSYISMLVNKKATIQLPTALHLAHCLGLIRFVEDEK